MSYRQELSDQKCRFFLSFQDIPINFAMAARIRGDFSLAQLRTALQKVRQRHPKLAIGITTDGSGQHVFTSEGIPEIPVHIVERQSDGDWVKVTEQELARPFKFEPGPIVRFAWLRGVGTSELVIVCHHFWADGLSAAYVLRDLLGYLGDPAMAVDRLPLPPRMEDLAPPAATKDTATRLQIALWRSLATIVGSLYEVRKRLFGNRKKPRRGPDLRQDKHYLFPWSLTEAQTAAVVARARREKTTVHAALCAAFLRAFAEQEGQGNWERKVSCPVDVRDRLTAPVGDAFGTFNVIVNVPPVDCSPERDFWDVARETKQRLTDESADDKAFRSHLLMQALGAATERFDPQAFASYETFAKVDYDLSITNLGRLDFPLRYGPLQLDVMYGPLLVAYKDEKVLGVSTVDGKMTCTLAFADFAMDVATAGQIKGRAMRHLGAATGWGGREGDAG